VRYEGDSISHNKTEFHVVTLPHKDFTAIPVDWHSSMVLQDSFSLWFAQK
jgi:hypothetical protein